MTSIHTLCDAPVIAEDKQQENNDKQIYGQNGNEYTCKSLSQNKGWFQIIKAHMAIMHSCSSKCSHITHRKRMISPKINLFPTRPEFHNRRIAVNYNWGKYDCAEINHNKSIRLPTLGYMPEIRPKVLLLMQQID